MGKPPPALLRFFLWLGRNRVAEKAAAARGCKWTYMFLNTNGDDMEWLLKNMASGKIQPVIDSTFPLSRATEAVDLSFSGRAAGKVVIDLAA